MIEYRLFLSIVNVYALGTRLVMVLYLSTHPPVGHHILELNVQMKRISKLIQDLIRFSTFKDFKSKYQMQLFLVKWIAFYHAFVFGLNYWLDSRWPMEFYKVIPVLFEHKWEFEHFERHICAYTSTFLNRIWSVPWPSCTHYLPLRI